MEEPQYCFLFWQYQFTFPSTVHRVPFSLLLTSICYLLSFDASHSNYGTKSNYDFDLHFPDGYHFMLVLTIWIFSLEKSQFRLSVHFLNWINWEVFCFDFAIGLHAFLICFGYWPIRYVACKYFSHSVGCLFILLIIPFAVQKFLFSLM